MNLKRVIQLKKSSNNKGSIIYWMSREQRVSDNWALLFAYNLAKQNNSGVIIFFNVVNTFLEATWRQYAFMLKGLQELEKKCKQQHLNIIIKTGAPIKNIQAVIKEYKASHVITEFDPLRIKQQWKSQLTKQIDINIYEVDAHNIVPCRIASNKQEFGAYTLRPKIKKLLPGFLDEFPPLPKLESRIDIPQTNWNEIYNSLRVNMEVSEITHIISGEKAAHEQLSNFLENVLSKYATERNDPNKNATSGLSPYLHFGQISVQRITIEILKKHPTDESTEAFLEELIVRKELSDNFCFYNPNYDNFEGFPDWARKTLIEHAKDEHEFIYTLQQFENAQTHDKLWNAAQLELKRTGTMHGYMRMYWAKKILEWSSTPHKALEIAIYLNDKYQLDGRDPNGYTGCAWSIGGVHDRAWSERPIFGKIRYMNYNGCKRKFDIQKYINRIETIK